MSNRQPYTPKPHRMRRASADWSQPKPKPERPDGLPHGSWLGDLGDLSEVEQQLLEHARAGEPLLCGEERPEEATPENTIQASLIRFLMLGGDAQNPVHPKGVDVRGAFINGQLDLEGCQCELRLVLAKCRFSAPVWAVNARLGGLYLNGSDLPGLNAEGAVVKGDVFLKDGFEAKGEVRLNSAEIYGQLSCVDGRFYNCDADGAAKGRAINAQGVKIADCLFLHGAECNGEVSLAGAEIAGQLSFERAVLRHCDSGGTATGRALGAEDAVIKDGLFFLPARIEGEVDFTSATATNVIDSKDAWPKHNFFLDGFTYERFTNNQNAKDRISWLRSQHPSQLAGKFAPQPWEQLAKVFRENGHNDEAIEVSVAKEETRRKAIQLNDPISIFWSWLYGALAGFGYRPHRIVYTMLAITLLSAFAYQEGSRAGYFGPTDPRIYQLAEKAECGPGGKNWVLPECNVPPEYSTFQPTLYSIDLILPLVDLHQESDWQPIVTDEQGKTVWVGWLLRSLMWFQILFGWFGSFTLVTIIGRLVEKD